MLDEQSIPEMHSQGEGALHAASCAHVVADGEGCADAAVPACDAEAPGDGNSPSVLRDRLSGCSRASWTTAACSIPTRLSRVATCMQLLSWLQREQQRFGRTSHQLDLQHTSRPKVWNVGCCHALFDLFILQHLRASLTVSAANATSLYPGSGATSITKGRLVTPLAAGASNRCKLQIRWVPRYNPPAACGPCASAGFCVSAGVA